MQSSVCMVQINIFLSTGVVVAYIRDCSDGINFSINASRFLNFPQDKNITTCSYVQGKFFTCLSMCNTDLCNGPQAAPNTSSSSKTVPFWTMVFLVAMSLYQWQLNFFHYYWKMRSIFFFFYITLKNVNEWALNLNVNVNDSKIHHYWREVQHSNIIYMYWLVFIRISQINHFFNLYFSFPTKKNWKCSFASKQWSVNYIPDYILYSPTYHMTRNQIFRWFTRLI